jgi:Family of unknown function (DUF6152)
MIHPRDITPVTFREENGQRSRSFCMKISLLCVLATVLGLSAMPALAHHSFAAEYDNKKPVDLTGTVTKVEWMNPHARFYLDVKDDAGKVTNWEFELGSPNGLMRQGWTRNSMKIGDSISVQGAMAKDGSNLANARTVKLSDGRRLFAGSASETGRDEKKEQ